MDKDEASYSVMMQGNYSGIDNSGAIPEYSMNGGLCTWASLERLGFGEHAGVDSEMGIEFLKFPVLSERFEHEGVMNSSKTIEEEEIEEEERETGSHGAINSSKNSRNESVGVANSGGGEMEQGKGRRKRGRSMKTSEEVENQRMTHIAVERNRRKQMNEHLRVLRSLMPASYVQRGDQASIIGGAIEFVRELEQLLQCLESQKRRRILGGAEGQGGGLVVMGGVEGQQQQMAVEEEGAERRSCVADIEVRVAGGDAMIKVLSRRRPGQLLRTIAALEEMPLSILHTNITTIDHTVLYSFNVKIIGDSRFTAEDIASSVQQIFNFIHANTI
ncbi:hypothetical protein AMTRI_Chr06g198240 [Amborella trichopoda]|uniref:BHLH domain-containing protein n=1 Tax=Amborella trichopoda TaxID=13333 RepID=W1P4D2_AMBTC|nr:transcription factor FAMA [Amborella trichopoda]ERN01815.1 hypothetical protein AMTR_s00089p00043950 [Amborella trichopoda]|eukprot:XP_006840140.1 transcription factor FAMA [Amborella trichopoda]